MFANVGIYGTVPYISLMLVAYLFLIIPMKPDIFPFVNVYMYLQMVI